MSSHARTVKLTELASCGGCAAKYSAARLEEYGNEVRFYENIEGGHGGSVTNEQLAYRIALSFAHLWRELSSRAGDSS